MDLSRIVQGWAVTRADQERKADGVELIRAGIAGWGATGSSLGLPHFLSLLASCLGNKDEALENLDEARRLMEETGQWVFESQINRMTAIFFDSEGSRIVGELISKRPAAGISVQLKWPNPVA